MCIRDRYGRLWCSWMAAVEELEGEVRATHEALIADRGTAQEDIDALLIPEVVEIALGRTRDVVTEGAVLMLEQAGGQLDLSGEEGLERLVAGLYQSGFFNAHSVYKETEEAHVLALLRHFAASEMADPRCGGVGDFQNFFKYMYRMQSPLAYDWVNDQRQSSRVREHVDDANLT
eukprot:TRINITY_DN16317_c0_g1_i1.p2 TRINITY_DN16317_c0_g1~~TRINITY_DN16317_c0_g1_i1.p2  ORF type:complete len:175 (-),score=54.13 TRINITY_DN16317_c0_g1_i1:332-856(-)